MLFLIAALVVVVLSSEGIVRSLSKISIFLRITNFTVAFILIAITTSLPELFIGISSAAKGVPEITFGNVVGANIITLTLVTGLAIVVVRGFKIKSRKMEKDSLLMFLITLIPLLCIFIGGKLSRIDGIILLLIFIGYVMLIIKEGKGFSKFTKEYVKKSEFALYSLLLLVCLGALFLSSRLAIDYAVTSANELGVDTMIVGLILVALGTSLPELSFSVTSVLHHKEGLYLGDLMGSVVANSTLVLGVTSIIHPITGKLPLLLFSGAFMAFAAFLFSTFISSGRRLSLKEGLAMIFLYIIFIMVQIFIPSAFFG